VKPLARPLFLERQSYRFRRTTDAARLLPVLGIFLFLLPLLWQPADPAGDVGGGTGVGLTARLVYLFSVWLALIVAAAVLARRLARADPGGQTGQTGQTATPKDDR